MRNSSLVHSPSPVASAVPASFFYPHGYLAPGVKLMRLISFKTKAIIISLMFLLPLALSTSLYVKGQQEQIQFSVSEREGVQAMRRYIPLVKGLMDTQNANRLAAAGVDASQAKRQGLEEVTQALAAFEQYIRDSHDRLQLQDEFNRLKAAWATAAQSSTGIDPATGRTVYQPVTTSSLKLLQNIGDNSKLVLDPDIDSFYLVNAYVLSLPKLLSDVAYLRSWGAYGVAKGGLQAQETQRYAVWIAGALNGSEATRGHFERSIKANPDLGQTLKLDFLDSVRQFAERVRDPVKIKDAPSPGALYADGTQVLNQVLGSYDGGLAALDQLLQKRIHGFETNLQGVGVVLVVFLLLAIYLFYAFFLVTQGGLKLISGHLKDMAAGDLRRAPSQPWGQDEPARVIVDLKLAYDALRHLIEAVRYSADELHSAAGQISEVSRELSARTESAAASLEQQASAMEQIGSTVANTAAHAQESAALAQSNAQVADRGGDVIAQAVTVMGEINSSSQKIGDIIGVIDGIAFQTNILALNAAVEAARAGEQGRGFAVVASEVRALAQRSANAAKEIKTLITSSIEKAESGASVVQSAGQTMNEILGNARQINGLLGSIATGAREQASGVEQVGHAIQVLDQDTQRNAAMVEETALSAGLLKQQADNLLHELEKFQLQ